MRKTSNVRIARAALVQSLCERQTRAGSDFCKGSIEGFSGNFEKAARQMARMQNGVKAYYDGQL